MALLQFAWLRGPLSSDLFVRSGEMWNHIHEESSESPHKHSMTRETAKLHAMEPKEVHAYAKEEHPTTQQRRVDKTKLSELVTESYKEFKDKIAELVEKTKQFETDAIKIEGKKGKSEKILKTEAHLKCENDLETEQRKAWNKIKDGVTKVLLENLKTQNTNSLRHELKVLPLPELKRRADVNHIRFTVEDEDAWEQGGAHDHTMDEDGLFLGAEQREKMENQNQEAHEKIEEEKGKLVELIVKAEVEEPSRKTRLCQWLYEFDPLAAVAHCLNVQRFCLVKVFPWCEKTITVEFDDDGPLGIKFAPSGTSVKIVAIRDYGQADSDDKLSTGLVLRYIKGQAPENETKEQKQERMLWEREIKSTPEDRKQHVLGLLSEARRPLTMAFVPGNVGQKRWTLKQCMKGSDSESDDDDDINQDATAAERESSAKRKKEREGPDAFWDNEEYVPAEIKVEDIEADGSDDDDDGFPRAIMIQRGDGGQDEQEDAPQRLREYGAALVAMQHLVDRVESMTKAIDDIGKKPGSAKKHVLDKERKSKVIELGNTQVELKEVETKIAKLSDPRDDDFCGYAYEKCTIHVEGVPDSFGIELEAKLRRELAQDDRKKDDTTRLTEAERAAMMARLENGMLMPLHEEIKSLFSVFGRVLQVTIQRRPGINSNWALVTMCDQVAIKGCLSTPRRYTYNRTPTDEQAKALGRIGTLQAKAAYISGYGHSWLEASERAEASVRGLALGDDTRVRNDNGMLIRTEHTKGNNVDVPRRRAEVCQRRRQVAAQMRVCESAVDALFYACDRDNSGTLDREELAILMAELSGGTRVSEFSVQFVIDQVQSHGSGEITRERLKQVIPLWRYLQHEQEFVAEQFDEFDKRTKGKIIGKNEVGVLLKMLNSDNEHPDGIPPTVAEVEWVMNKANPREELNTNKSGGVNRAELRSAIALWYPFVHNRRRVEDLPSSVQAKAGRRRRAVAATLGVHIHHVGVYMQDTYPPKVNEKSQRPHMYELTLTDLADIMSDLISTTVQREQVGKNFVDYVASTADLQGSETFEPEEVSKALAMWLCTRAVQPAIDAALLQYDSSNTGKQQRDQLHDILTELNDGIPVTRAETEWVLESSDIDGNGTISRDEMRVSAGWWFLHVARRQVKTVGGWKALMPWLCSAFVGLVCAYVVAVTSVRFTEEKTQRWLENTTLTIALKQLVLEPLEVLLCGTCFDQSSTAQRLVEAFLGLRDPSVSDVHGGETSAGDIESHLNVDGTVDAGTGATNVFLVGSTGVAMKRIADRGRVKAKAVEAATQAARDSQKTLQNMQSQRAEMNAIYAQKVAQKRLEKGLNRGTFAARAEVDMIAVSQFMATDQEQTRDDEKKVLGEIKELDEQEAAELAKPVPDENDLRRIRDRRRRARKRHLLIEEKKGDMELQDGGWEWQDDQGNWRSYDGPKASLLEQAFTAAPKEHAVLDQDGWYVDFVKMQQQNSRGKVRWHSNALEMYNVRRGNVEGLLKKAQKEGEDHARHIKHMKDLQSAKTAERVRRKRDAKKGKKVQEDAGAALRKSRWSKTRQGVGALGLAKIFGQTQVEVRAEEPAADEAVPAVGPPVGAGAMSSVEMAEAGVRRSARNPNQLKVNVPSGKLKGAVAECSLIDEVNSIRNAENAPE